ncbi:RluA family pseudouridine synthase [Jonquetella sp. BV3C21]|uniref:RluA family pseudouridine synthase n=1 Tax=Jonquetella sp. BV3C21 TaxID=1111126 RepID=UPI0003ADC057|nr:RluA family pseudouridine synthase [Jonquetella sp. BV3C21]ERL23867.1 pseudouridine synthase, RluA family [Jonquetella sp. BV3C21]
MDSRRIVVEPSDAGNRLDLYLSGQLELSRSAVGRLISGGLVSGVGKVKASRVVVSGDWFDVSMPEPSEESVVPQDVPFRTVYADDWLAVVEKLAGIAVHPGAGRKDGTLVNGLVKTFGPLPGVGLRPGIVHRLDIGTSGLMVVARTPQAYLFLQREFSQRRVEKTYLALVHGWIPASQGTLDGPIGRSRYDRLKMAVRADGRRAVTRYRTLWTRGSLSLTACRIETGRTHQIRVHMASIGCYLDGDRLYGPKDVSRHFLEGRVFLHAWRLSFHHPSDGRTMNFRSPLPDELIGVLKKIRSE